MATVSLLKRWLAEAPSNDLLLAYCLDLEVKLNFEGSNEVRLFGFNIDYWLLLYPPITEPLLD
jgi:hypothetical protein